MNLSQLVASCSSLDGRTFDPATHIRAVNAIVAETPDAAVAALRAHAQELSGRSAGTEETSRLLLLLRTLIDPEPPDAGLPPLMLGSLIGGVAPTPALPRHPILLAGDVPLLVVEGVILRGLPEDPADHLEQLLAAGTLRAAPLSPPSDPRPLEAEVLEAVGLAPDAPFAALLRGQLERVARSAPTEV